MAMYRAPPQFDPFAPDAERYDGELDDAFANMDRDDPLSFFKAIGAGQPGALLMPKLLSTAAVKGARRQRAARICNDRRLLNDIVERHEATLQKRWMKKTKEQRRKILLSAWHNMAVAHRPDFEAFTKESEQQRMAGTRFRDAFPWPYINLEDLSKSRALLLFLM